MSSPARVDSLPPSLRAEQIMGCIRVRSLIHYLANCYNDKEKSIDKHNGPGAQGENSESHGVERRILWSGDVDHDKNHSKQIEAFEMLIWRKVLPISRTWKVTNQEVQDTHDQQYSLMKAHGKYWTCAMP